MANFSIFEFKKNPNTPEAQAWFNSLDLRSQSNIYPHAITERSHPCVRLGLDQCFGCGGFGHRLPCNRRGAMAFQHWRTSVNGKSYSLDVLDMPEANTAAMPEAHTAAANNQIAGADDFDDTPMTLTPEDVALLDVIENAGQLLTTRNAAAIHAPVQSTSSKAPNEIVSE